MTLIDINAPVSVQAQAHRLRELADVLEHTGLSGLTLSVFVRPAYDYGPQDARVAAVDELAAALGLTAEASVSSGMWAHQARHSADQITLYVTTSIDEPAKRCACGARCTHGGA